MTEIKPSLPQWVDPGEVKHTWPPPDPKGIVSRQRPDAVVQAKIEGIIVEGTAEFNRYFKASS